MNILKNKEESNSSDAKKYLLTDECFRKLKKVQREIYNKTDLFPSIRKMIDIIITDEIINKLKEKLISQFSE